MIDNDILFNIKEKAIADKVPIIMDDTLKKIREILEPLKPIKILEIGTAVGYSAICFSCFLAENGKIDTIERDEQKVKEANNNINLMGLKNTINVLYGDATEILPTLNDKYDVVFIDAAKGRYPFFLEQALRLINDNGIILADNILYKGYVLSDYNKHKQRTAVRNLREYISKVSNNPNLETEILDIGDGLAISKYKRGI